MQQMEPLSWSTDKSERGLSERSLLAFEHQFRSLVEQNADGIIIVDAEGVVCFVNVAAERLLNRKSEVLIGEVFGFPVVAGDKTELDLVHSSGDIIVVEMRVAEITWEGHRAYLASLRDITEHREMKTALQRALSETQRRAEEVAALLKGSRAVLENQDFEPAAQAIFTACKNVIGAVSGYVALLNKDGTENDVLYLDSGGLPCTVDPDLPMPIRGLRADAYRTCQAVYNNEFMHSGWEQLMPEGHVCLNNVLFAPLVLEGRAVGLLGLANKPGGFTDEDARMAMAFGEIAAVALRNSHMLEALTDSEKRFHGVVSQSHDAIVLIDGQGHVLEWNRSAEQLFGIPREDVIESPLSSMVKRVIPDCLEAPKSCAEIVEELEELFAEGDAPWLKQLYDVEIKSGEGVNRYIQVIVFPIQMQDMMLFGIVARDITERRQMELQLREALDQKEILLREIHHRVKNNLAVVSSLLDFQSDSITDPQAREAFLASQNRIHSMAYIHELLYRSRDLAVVNFEQYIRDLAEHLQRSYGAGDIVFAVDIGDVALDIDTAIPCGLIVNELVSNALKHAFPPQQRSQSDPRGLIQIEMEALGDGHIALHIADNGCGLPDDLDWLAVPSLGLRLVHMLTRQIHGTIEVGGEQGLDVEIVFPQPEV